MPRAGGHRENSSQFPTRAQTTRRVPGAGRNPEPAYDTANTGPEFPDAAQSALPPATRVAGSRAERLGKRTCEMLNPVQKCLNFQLHSWSSGFTCSIECQTRLNKPKTSFFAVGSCATLRCGSGDKALQECNLSTGPSVDCNDCIPPGSGKLSDRVFVFGDASASHGQSEKLIVPLSAVRPQFSIGLPTNSTTDPENETQLRIMRLAKSAAAGLPRPSPGRLAGRSRGRTPVNDTGQHRFGDSGIRSLSLHLEWFQKRVRRGT